MKKPVHIHRFSLSRREKIILAVSIVIVVGWGFYYSYVAEQYGRQHAISLTALLVASIAAVAMLLSLNWTRDTIRPFISLSGDVSADMKGTYVNIPLKICNSGSIPASGVHVTIDFFHKNEEVTEDNLSGKFLPAAEFPAALPIFPIVFPNDSVCTQYILDLKDKNDLELWGKIKAGEVKFRLRINYTSLGRKHVTIQTEQITKVEWEKKLILTPVSPWKWK